MNSKPATPFQPAPRPKPLNDVGSVAALKEATADLGFKRPTSAPPASPPADPVVAPAEAKAPEGLGDTARPVVETGAPTAATKAATKAKSAAGAATEPAGRVTAVRVEMADTLAMALKMEAVRRRVTVRYLIIEALAAKGYAVDQADLQEDGRRLR